MASGSTNAVIPLRNLSSTASPQIPTSSANSPVSHNRTAVRLPAAQQPLSVSANSQSNSWERCYKVAQVLCAAVLAIMGVLAAYWTLMVSWWTAEKDFRDDCRSQNTTLGYMSTDCTFKLSKPLQSPPVPVDFHAKRSQAFTESQWHTVVLVVPWRRFYIHYSVSYDETHRPGFETMIPAIVTIVCVLCPVFYLFGRRYLRQRCTRNPSPLTWTGSSIARTEMLQGLHLYSMNEFQPSPPHGPWPVTSDGNEEALFGEETAWVAVAKGNVEPDRNTGDAIEDTVGLDLRFGNWVAEDEHVQSAISASFTGLSGGYTWPKNFPQQESFIPYSESLIPHSTLERSELHQRTDLYDALTGQNMWSSPSVGYDLPRKESLTGQPHGSKLSRLKKVWAKVRHRPAARSDDSSFPPKPYVDVSRWRRGVAKIAPSITATEYEDLSINPTPAEYYQPRELEGYMHDLPAELEGDIGW